MFGETQNLCFNNDQKGEDVVILRDIITGGGGGDGHQTGSTESKTNKSHKMKRMQTGGDDGTF